MNFISEYNSFVSRVENLIEHEDYIKAADLLKKGLAKNPNDRGFQRFYFRVLLKLGRYEEAKFWLSKVILRYEKSSQIDTFYYKGLYYFLEGEFKQSMEFLKKCFEIDIYYLKKLLYDNAFDSLKDSAEFKILITPTKEFVVNKFISLKLIFSKTLIYVCDDLFLTCQKIAINIVPFEIEKYTDFNDIDDIIDFYKSHSSTKEEISITPEEEFWGHCSNLQAWVENDYNTCVLSKNLSFPLLKELSGRGFPYFTTIFKEELIHRIKMGGIKTLLYFIADTEENYLNYLTEEDLFDNLLPFEEAEIIKNIRNFIPLEYTLTTSLRDSRRFPSVRDDKKMHFCIENNHISELEILLDDKSYSDQYHSALLQVKNLRYLEELAIYRSYDINNSDDRLFLKALHNFDNLSLDLL
jgi:tetratricopeptide (TPR) repeat protein